MTDTNNRYTCKLAMERAEGHRPWVWHRAGIYSARPRPNTLLAGQRMGFLAHKVQFRD